MKKSDLTSIPNLQYLYPERTLYVMTFFSLRVLLFFYEMLRAQSSER